MAGQLTTVVDVSTSNALLLPDPEPRPVHYTIISVDDHLVEPPGMFDGRLPRALQPDAPRVFKSDDGSESWVFEGKSFSQIGLNAIAGRRKDTWNREPARFSDMRPGCWDIHARIADMDINGVWASVNFPSQIAGFCGRNFREPRILNLDSQSPEPGMTGCLTNGIHCTRSESCQWE